jgi:hypothetical protein
MTSRESSVNCDKLRDTFEGREAIYLEKDVLRVRVTNIRCNPAGQRIDAEVEEVSTPGLACGIFYGCRSNPLRREIGAGDLTRFSEDTWENGYGWSLFFAPEIVNGLASLAADWATELDAHERYERACRFLADHGAWEGLNKRVFPD